MPLNCDANYSDPLRFSQIYSDAAHGGEVLVPHRAGRRSRRSGRRGWRVRTDSRCDLFDSSRRECGVCVGKSLISEKVFVLIKSAGAGVAGLLNPRLVSDHGATCKTGWTGWEGMKFQSAPREQSRGERKLARRSV